MVKKNWLLILNSILVILVVGLGFLLKLNIERKGWEEIEKTFPDRGVPRINITLEDVSLEEINGGSKETKYEGNRLSLYNGRQVDDYENVEVKGRGNSTWLQPKKPYQIRFSRNIDLLGMGKAKKWVLLANYLDTSFVRNDTAFIMAEMLEEQYSSRGEFVELYFNGEYEGLYYLMKKISVSKTSVDLRNHDGVLFEMDLLHNEEDRCYMSLLEECMILKDSVSEEISDETKVKKFMEDFNRLERAAIEKNYEEVTKLADVESFAKYYLINEFSANPDAYSSSFYFYKDGALDKIHAGPVWDFDYAFCNLDWGWNVDEAFFSPVGTMIRKKEAFSEEIVENEMTISKLLYYMMELPDFKEKVSQIFQKTLSGRKDEFVAKIIGKKEEIEGAIIVDEEKWRTDDDEADFDEMIEWIKTRYDYFEREYGGSKNNSAHRLH